MVKVGAAALFFVFGGWLLLDATEQLTGQPAWTAVTAGLDHHVAAWIALVLGVAATVIGVSGRRPALGRAVGSGRWWARGLFGLAMVLGLGAPLLVAADVIDPVPFFDDPGVVVVGAGLALLGMAVLLASRVAGVRGCGPCTRRAARTPASATPG
ncbi:hypothetical protein BJF78_34170 [Pseudonocardia sp. CNS-139]|nr:hypothetical protein BJF78_34170 [Pseudonocardia sp. CNS-139]